MWEFRLREIDDLKRLSEQLNVSVEAIEDVSILAQPVRAGGLLIPNSLAVHPMEGCDGDAQGRPGKLTLRRYERFAAGGAGLIWGEATAVAPEARANPRQLWIHEGSKDSFAAMVKMMRRAAAKSMGTGPQGRTRAPVDAFGQVQQTRRRIASDHSSTRSVSRSAGPSASTKPRCQEQDTG